MKSGSLPEKGGFPHFKKSDSEKLNDLVDLLRRHKDAFPIQVYEEALKILTN